MKPNKNKIKKVIKQKEGIILHIGCGDMKVPGTVGLDVRDIPGVDIVHDLEKFPYPIEDGKVVTCIASHVLEHLDPRLTIKIFDELWRIMKPGAQLMISLPYAGSYGYWQDPTHCNGFNEATFTYFDPQYPTYPVYKPKPWKIIESLWESNGNMEVVMEKREYPND